MPGASTKKRTHDERAARPSKKQKRAIMKKFDSDDEGDDFQAVNLLDSDEEDIHKAVVDDGASDNGASSSDDNGTRQRIKKPTKGKKNTTTKTQAAAKAKPEAKSAPKEDGSEADDNDSEADEDSEDDSEGSNSDGEQQQNTKSKRNDPTAFSTSISKILSTKLPTSRRADPVLARSAAANTNARAAADAALELKAKRHIKVQRKEALEKGRVKDVLEASSLNELGAGDEGNTAVEMRLRKVAQRGVVRLFNAVRASQVKAAEAERAAKKEGIIGLTNKEAKVNEMSKKGFLDLIASGGGALKKGALEES